jgi:hypothetical protein
MVLCAWVGCGGSSQDARDAASADRTVAEVASDDTTADQTSGTDAPAAGDADAASDAQPVDARNDASADANDDRNGVSATDAGGGDALTTIAITVTATKNLLELATCKVSPAVFDNVPAGTYTIALAASTLSKGNVAVLDVPSVDNYVIVALPLAAGDPQQDHRFFMLHGIGANAQVTLSAQGTIQVMFVDADSLGNMGQATVTLNPGNYTTTVDAATNVLRWDEGCMSTPVTATVDTTPHRVTLADSTLSSGAGSHDDYVVVRIPDETPMNDHRWIILNGVGASFDFQAFNDTTLSAWFISAAGGVSGQATVDIARR